MYKHFKFRWNEINIQTRITIAFSICSILQKGINLLTLPLFIRMLSTEQFGHVTIYSSWYSILMIFLTLMLPFGSFSKAMIKFEDDRWAYVSSSEGICLLLSTAFLLIYFVFNKSLSVFFKLPSYIIVLMVFEIIFDAGISFWSGKKRFEYECKEIICVTILITLFTPLIQYYLICNMNEKGYAFILGNAITKLIFGGIIFVRNILCGKILFDKAFWKYSFGLNLPLILYYLSQSIFNSSDRIMIDYFCGESKTAIYGFAYNFATILMFLLTAVNNSYVPWFFNKMKEGKQRDNASVSTYISLLLSVLLLGVVWFAPELISLIAGEEYREAKNVVFPVALSFLLMFFAQIPIDVEFFYEKRLSLILSSLAAAIINIVLNMIFIPLFDYIAASYTTLFSYFIFATLNFISMKIIYHEKSITESCINLKMLTLIFIFFSLIGALGVILYYSFWLRLFIMTVLFSTFFFVFKKKLKEIYKLLFVQNK